MTALCSRFIHPAIAMTRICHRCRCMATILSGTGTNVEEALSRWCRTEWPLNGVSGVGRVLIPYDVPERAGDGCLRCHNYHVGTVRSVMTRGQTLQMLMGEVDAR